MAALRNAGFRLFHPSRHIWFRASPQSGSAGTANNALHLEIGLTKRGLDDVGDMTLMRSMISSGNNDVSKGDSLLQIEWEGHAITSADELYHTVWESFSGTTNVETPVSGQVEHINIIHNTMCIEEDTVLAKLETTEAEWNSAMAKMVEEPEYHRIVGTIPLGKFAEPEEEAC
jgi:glycine cleavage system H lipoate-binding protein